MRGMRAAGVGVGLLVSFLGAASGQTPAARIARVRPVEALSSEARGQMPDPKAGSPMQPMLPPGGTPMNPGSAAGGTPPTLGQYQGLPIPTVTAEPGTGAKPAPPGGPAATFTLPMQSQPYPNTGAVQPYAPPTQSYLAPGQSYVVPGHPYASPGPVVSAPSVMPLRTSPPLLGGGPAPDLERPLFAGAFGPAALLGGPSRWSAHADLLLWWVKSPQVPTLLTTSSPQFNGVPGQGDTRVLFGNGSLPTSLHTGGRFGGTYWLDECHTWGLDGSVFFLGRNGKQFEASTGQYPLLARPFLNVNQAVPFSEIVAAPGLATGVVAITSDTQMWGAEANLRRSLLCGPCSRLDLFGGFRFLRLTDGLSVTENFNRTADSRANIGAPTALFGTVTDSFRTANHFYGVNLGAVGELRRGRLTAEARASVALGTVFQTAEIYGVQNIQFASGPTTTAGGLLALPGANIGAFHQNKFGVLPEAGLKISYDVTPHWKLGVGYNFLYLNSVVRAGHQIDTGLDVTRIPNFPLPGNIAPLPNTRPLVPLRTTDVFAQGVSFSLQYTW